MKGLRFFWGFLRSSVWVLVSFLQEFLLGSCRLASYSSSFGGLYGVLVQGSVLIRSLCGCGKVQAFGSRA